MKKEVIFSKKCKIKNFSVRNIWSISRKKNKTILDPKSILSPLKHGGGNVMIWRGWRGLSINKIGNLKLIYTTSTALGYIVLLRHKLLSCARTLGLEKTFHFINSNFRGRRKLSRINFREEGRIIVGQITVDCNLDANRIQKTIPLSFAKSVYNSRRPYRFFVLFRNHRVSRLKLVNSFRNWVIARLLETCYLVRLIQVPTLSPVLPIYLLFCIQN